jgi:hypothetical protein
LAGGKPQQVARAAVLSTALALPGCLSGAIYSHVTVPLDANFDATPVYRGEASDSWKTFQYYGRIDWGSTGLAEVAREHGMKRLYYADVETLTILRFWTQRWVHVYGE